MPCKSSHNNRHLAALVLFAIMGGTLAAAQNCTAIKADSERLICYDRAAVAPLTAVRSSAQTAVSKLLRDPGSAIFADWREQNAKDGSAGVCGTVNAKNAHGGYSGPKDFVYSVADKSALVLDMAGEILYYPPIIIETIMKDAPRYYQKYCFGDEIESTILRRLKASQPK